MVSVEYPEAALNPVNHDFFSSVVHRYQHLSWAELGNSHKPWLGRLHTFLPHPTNLLDQLLHRWSKQDGRLAVDQLSGISPIVRTEMMQAFQRVDQGYYAEPGILRRASTDSL